MPRSVLIVGAGPAAAGAALAGVEHPDVQITILDLGGRLEPPNEEARARLEQATSRDQWQMDDVALIQRLPEVSEVKGMPEKRAYGSDFPFRDLGQLRDVRALKDVNGAVISSAYGGFSNVWGAQVMPFSAATFREWPLAAEEMYSHYSRVLSAIPYAAEEDDLAELFPLLQRSASLPQLSQRSDAVLARYARHRKRLRRRGVTVGRARLAMSAPECIHCGLCLTGCPYCLIYSASQTLDALRAKDRITYRGGLMAVNVEEGDGGATVTAKDLRTGALHRFSADRVLLACGAIGSSRLAMGSLKLLDEPARLSESAQFMLPFISGSAVEDPRRCDDFSLNQFNLIVKLDADGYDVSQLHFYTYSSAFLDALPAPMHAPWARRLRRAVLRRLCVSLGYLPSWASPGFSIRASAPDAPDSLPPLTLSGEAGRFAANPMFRAVLARLCGSAPYLDLWPVLPGLYIPARGKSYHWGSTFPHSARPSGRFSTDTLGRVAPWTRVHLVDASVFPTVPATTFTLTIMANAHRIADTMLRELDF